MCGFHKIALKGNHARQSRPSLWSLQGLRVIKAKVIGKIHTTYHKDQQENRMLQAISYIKSHSIDLICKKGS